jgi:hypothetical protein
MWGAEAGGRPGRLRTWGQGVKLRRQSLRVVSWLSLAFLISQAGWLAWLDADAPGWDPEFAKKRARMNTLRAECPDRPLLVALGSSRTLMGIDGSAFDGVAAVDGRAFVGFNFGLVAAGPVRQWLTLRRILAEGVRPDVVLIEVATPFFSAPGPGRFCEEEGLKSIRLSAAEVLAVRPFLARPDRLRNAWLRAHLPPCTAQRRALVGALVPNWGAPPGHDFHHNQMDARGWAPFPKPAVGPEEFARSARLSEASYHATLRDFRAAPGGLVALADTLAECQRLQIRAAVVQAPEHSLFRAWGCTARPWLVAEVRRLAAAAGSEFIDAVDWVGDDGFWDPHHLLPGGAAVYSRRLADELSLRHVPPHDSHGP